MKIKVAAAEQRQFKQVEGLLECAFKHKVTSSEAQFNYTGPVFPLDMWEQILSFFVWTYGECKSESQVRLYVNPAQGSWQAWAMPQEYGTGMTTKEIDTPAGAEQRAQFREDEGWIYFGTVHHHCTASAFQSGVDKSNETSQDGIHITVGFITKAAKDMHVRFYLSGCEFEPDMSEFWEVGEATRTMAQQMASYFGVKVTAHEQAMRQMGQSRDNVTFPEQWKRNLIKTVTTGVTTTYYGRPGPNGYNAGSQGGMVQGSTWQGGGRTYGPGIREKRAYESMLETLTLQGLQGEELEDVVETLFSDPEIKALCDAMKEEFVDLEDMIQEHNRREIAMQTGSLGKGSGGGSGDHNQQALLMEALREGVYNVED